MMEIEAKFIIPDEETFAKLLALTRLGDYELVEAGQQDLVDRYYDTAVRDVWQGGYALRLREDTRRGRWRGTLKGLGGAEGAVHRREEHEVDVPAGALPATWPSSAARELALRLAGEAELGEMFAVAQRRWKREVRQRGGDSGDSGEGNGGNKGNTEGAEGRVVGELSLDEVRLAREGREEPGYELEIELGADGTPEDLEALEAALGEYGLRPQSLSKFERGLSLVGGGSHHEGTKELRDTKGEDSFTAESAEDAESGGEGAHGLEDVGPEEDASGEPPAPAARQKTAGVRTDEPMAEAGRKVLLFHFRRMVDNEAGARLGEDAEAVHDMRVATRRQRAALGLFEDYFKAKTIRPFEKGLKLAARRLGAVRDWDVLLEAAREYQAGLSEPGAAALQPVLEAWVQARDEARAALIEHLDDRDYARFKTDYAEFLETPGAGVAKLAEAHAPVLVRDVLPARLWEHYGAVRAYAEHLPGAPIETLHALRITGKRLRYAMEFFAEALDPSLREAIERVVALQDHLGTLNDADVTLAKLHGYLQSADPRPSPETVLAVGAYLRALEARLRQLKRTVGRPWRPVVGGGFRRRLAKAVAAL